MRIETLAVAYAVFEQSMDWTLDAEERKEVRAVFYAGAQCIIDILDAIGADTAKRGAIARSLILELQRFAEEMKAEPTTTETPEEG